MKYLKTRKDFLQDELQIESLDGSFVTKDKDIITANNELVDAAQTDQNESDPFDVKVEAQHDENENI